jgi:GT2 family glycosyltransferase
VICYNVGSMLARRTAFERVGAFDARYRFCEDVDWFMRAQELEVPFELLSDVVLHYRRHDTNMSLDHTGLATDLARVLKASLDRRRRLPDRANRAIEDIYYVRPGRLRI